MRRELHRERNDQQVKLTSDQSCSIEGLIAPLRVLGIECQAGIAILARSVHPAKNQDEFVAVAKESADVAKMRSALVALPFNEVPRDSCLSDGRFAVPNSGQTAGLVWLETNYGDSAIASLGIESGPDA